MRLGQLARKYDIPVQDIIEFLEEDTGEKFHANAKLYDTLEARVFDHFELLPEEAAEPSNEEESLVEAEVPIETTQEVEEKTSSELEEAAPSQLVENLPATPEEEIAAVEGEIILSDEHINQGPEEIIEVPVPIEETKERPSEEEIIQTDKLLEMLESEDSSADLEKIKLIKAPKKELSGLKVVGKVDLPEPKKKPEEAEEKVKSRNNNRRPKLSEEEKEKRRLKAKRKKEAYEARKEKRQKEQEARRRKEQKEAHYKQNLQKVEVKKNKQKEKSAPITNTQPKKDPKPAPKTLLGKWWRWMNT